MSKNKDTILRTLSILTLVMLLSCIFFVYIQYNSYTQSVYAYNSMYKNSIKDKDLFIQGILNENKNKAEMSMSIYADNIKKTILHEYKTNPLGLKNDIDIPSDTSKLSYIFDRSLDKVYINQNSNSNKAFVSSLNNILWSRSQLVGNPSSNSFYTWNEVIDDHFNKNLAAQAVSAIKNTDYSSNNIIFWQTKPFADSGDHMIPSMTMENIISMINEYGINSLKNCEMLVPVYITRNGDIFNNLDINSLGEKVDNYKIIIILRVNMYDAIKPYLSTITYYNTQISSMKGLITLNQKQKLYNTIGALIFSVCILIGSAYLQNKMLKDITAEESDEDVNKK